MRKFLKGLPFKKVFVFLFVSLYTFLPSLQAFGVVIEDYASEDVSVGVDEGGDILDEGISDPAEIANPNVLEEGVVEEPLFVYEDGVYRVFNVVEGEEYVYPDDEGVRVKFTNVTEEGNLVISKVTLTEQQKEELNTSDDYGWDISSSMNNGSFKYDLTLPNNTESDNVEVKYSEDGNTYESIDEVEVNENVIEIKGLEHFTLFVVSGGDDTTGSCKNVTLINPKDGDTCYTTIQAAIDAAISGDDVLVSEGTYTQSLSINKRINLIGAGSSVTTIKPNIVGGAVITVNAVTGPMTIEGFTIDALNYTNESGIYIQNGSSDITVNDNNIINFTDRGVVISNSSNNVLENNDIQGSASGSFAGAYLDDQAGNNTIDNNRITLATSTSGSGLLYDIWFTGTNPQNNTVKNNTINGGLRAFQQDSGVSGAVTFTGNNIGPSEYGISITGGSAIITDNFIKDSKRPIEFNGSGEITITGNTIDGTYHDFINIGSDFTGTLNPIQHNSFLNMGSADLHNRTVKNVDATENYWGNLDPSDNINNSGGGSIDYSPWWGEDYVESDNSTGWTWYTNDSIQDAIDAVSAGGTVNVAEGTYDPFKVVEKNDLTIQSSGVVTVKGVQVVSTNYGERDAIVFIDDSTDIVLDGLRIGSNTGKTKEKDYGIIYENSSGRIENCTVSPDTSGDMNSSAIGIWDSSNVTIDACTINNFGRIGVFIYNRCTVNISGGSIEGQVYSGENEVCYGIEVEGAYNDATLGTGSQVVIDGVEIYNCDNTFTTGPSWVSGGVYINGWMGYYDEDDSTVTVRNCHIHDNYIGVIAIKSSSSSAWFNNIYDNRVYGVESMTAHDGSTAVFDATQNWWGFSDGPSGKGSGSGDSISDNVKYCPWLDAEENGNPVGPCLGDLSGRTFIDNNWNGLLLNSDGDYTSGMMSGFTVRLYNESWNLLEEQETSTTGQIGQFHFANLDNTDNTYYVCGAYRDGYFYSPAQIGQPVVNVNGNHPSGYKFAEIVENNSNVSEESPVCWKITLDSETDGAYLGIGYTQEAPGTPTQTGYKDQNGVSYSCTDDYTNMPSIAVYWSDVLTGDTPPDDMLLYQRQYSLNGTSWSGSEIYSDPYTNQKSFGGGGGYDGVFYSRVRAFYDINKDGTYSSGEPVSGWSTVCSITHDTENPEITLELPENGKVYSGVIDLKAVCNEDCDYINFWWRAEGESYSNTSPDRRYHYEYTDGTEFEWSLNTLNAERWGGDPSYEMTDGTYYIYAAGKDLAGNWARTPDVQIIVDNTPPIVNITSPNDGGLYKTDVNLSGTVTDTNPHHYWLQITKDGTNLNITGITGVQSATEFNTTLTEDGEYNVTFAARDAAGGTNRSGNRSEDINISFTIDKTSPEAPIINFPSENQYFNSTPILNDWSEVTDESGIAYYRIEYQYDDEHTFPNAPYRETSDGATTQRNHTPGVKEEGGVRFRVQAFDNAGNEGKWSDWRHYYYIDSNPVVSLVSPEDNFITNQGGFVQSWSVDDFHQEHIDHYEYRSCWNNPTDENGTCNPLHENNNLTSTSRTVGKQGDKTFWWQVRAVDKAGNVGDWADARKAILDSTPPVVDITSPLNTYVTGSVEIKGSVEDLHPDHYYLVIKDSNGQILQGSPETIQRDASFTNELLYTWNTTLFGDGEYTIHLVAEDAAGNSDDTVSSYQISVTVDNTPPVTTLNEEIQGIFTNDPILIEGETTDILSSVDFVNLYYSLSSNTEENWILIDTVDNSDNNSPFAWDYTWTPDAEGTYDIKASATDTLGNEEQSAYIYDVTYDTTDPEVLLDLVLGVLNITAEDLLSGIYTIQVSKDNKTTWEDYTPNMSLNDLVGNQPGTYTIYIKVTDKAGNITTKTDSFTIPSPTLTTTDTGEDILGTEDKSPLKPPPVNAYNPTYLLSQTDEQNTEEEEITEEETTTQDSPEVKGEENNEEQNGEEEPTEQETTKWWVYPLVILPVLAIFLILWKRRKEDNEPQF